MNGKGLMAMKAALSVGLIANPWSIDFAPMSGDGIPRWPDRRSYRSHQRQKAKRKNQRRAAL